MTPRETTVPRSVAIRLLRLSLIADDHRVPVAVREARRLATEAALGRLLSGLPLHPEGRP